MDAIISDLMLKFKKKSPLRENAVVELPHVNMRDSGEHPIFVGSPVAVSSLPIASLYNE